MTPSKLAAGSIVAAGIVVLGSAAMLVAAETGAYEQHVSLVAMKFDYLPDTITVKKGVPVVLEISTLDRLHGFEVPSLGLHAQIAPGPPTIVRFTPEKTGSFGFHCDVFCGDGHEGMEAQIIVTD